MVMDTKVVIVLHSPVTGCSVYSPRLWAQSWPPGIFFMKHPRGYASGTAVSPKGQQIRRLFISSDEFILTLRPTEREQRESQNK